MNNNKTEEKISSLVSGFNGYIDYFKKDNTFSGPSDYFYLKIMKKIEGDPEYNAIFTDDFIELLYATLVAWGMHRMGPENMGAKMNDFKPFRQCIIDSKRKIMSLRVLRIDQIELDVNLMSQLKDLYTTLSPLMKSKSKLVATSKIMHFLLPHLVAPMDRQYTMQFFRKTLPTIKSEDDSKKEIEIFQYVFAKMHYIAMHVDWTGFIYDEFSRTMPKAIDNAIVGCVRKTH